eukprot:14286186-Alexandrium_andersonii.AAC.1
MSASLVGSEMCIRDRAREVHGRVEAAAAVAPRPEADLSSGSRPVPVPAQVAPAQGEQGEQSGQAEP